MDLNDEQPRVLLRRFTLSQSTTAPRPKALLEHQFEPHVQAAMPYRLDTHVLTVDANVIHKVDTANPANFNMWTVFSRCADSV